MVDRRAVMSGLALAPLLAPTLRRLTPTFPEALNLLFRSGIYGGLMQVAIAGPSDTVNADDAAQAAAFVGLEMLAAEYLADRFHLDGPQMNDLAQHPLAEISRRARETRIVVLSEWHHAPRHRWFLGRMLDALAPHGYQTLAAETFSPLADGLQNRNSLLRDHGLYLNDPVLARAVRRHLTRGGGLASYDTGEASLSQADREELQARNLAGVISRLPLGTKLVIYAGPGHGLEKSRAMAAQLRALTGVDPLTIGQKLDRRPLRTTHPEGVWISGGASGYDMIVRHFLDEDTPGQARFPDPQAPSRRIWRPRDRPMPEPLLVKAFALDAPSRAIPQDVVVLPANSTSVRLMCSSRDRILFE